MQLTLPIRDILTATPRARIVRFDLQEQSFDFLAGQAVYVSRAGGAIARRPYSIAIAPEESRKFHSLELLVGVDGNGNAGPHLPLQTGASIAIDGPLGSFTFPTEPRERNFAFIAGGTGIAPLRAMLHHALGIPHDHIGVFYSARTPDEFAYEAELRELNETGRIEFHQTITRSADETWSGARGRIGREDLQRFVRDPATLCFICGPPALVSGTSALVREMGIDEERIRVERWG